MAKTNITLQIDFAPATLSDAPYERADHVQVAIFGPTVSITFHQLNYQAIADGGPHQTGDEPRVPTIIVGRVVMDVEAFERMALASSQVLAERKADMAASALEQAQ